MTLLPDDPKHLTSILLFAIFAVLTSTSHATVQLTDLRCEYRVDPLGIENIHPRLSWKIIDSDKTRGQKQTGHRILVASKENKLKQNIGDLWDTGLVPGAQSVNNVYNGTSLSSGQQCFWKVCITDASGKLSDWSPIARFTVGLLDPTDWKGEWVYKADQEKTDHNWYRKSFKLYQEPRSAFVYVASFGYHELYVNGEKVTDNVLNPVASFMKKRIPYLTYDVSDYLTTGDNVIAIWHAAGWARWRRTPEYRSVPFVFKAQVEIATNENELSFGSDESWKCKKSYSSYFGDWDVLDFGGEIIDDRLHEEDWNRADYDDSGWGNARVYRASDLNAKFPDGQTVTIAINSTKDRTLNVGPYTDIEAELTAQIVQPQVRFKEVKPIEVKDNHDGTYRIDMGENYTGFFEMHLYDGTEGESVFFEISDRTEVTMNWNQKSQYIFGKSGKGRFTNRFNVAGGRWVTVYGLSSQPHLDDISGYVVTCDRPQVSKFECSNDLLNRIYQVNLNTYLANTLDGILMDCPHRERRGWGEVTVAAMYGDALPNFDSGAYMEQYLQFQRDAQLHDGQVRAVINEQDRPFLMWKANSPITVWETYKVLGDPKVLEDNYQAMQRWMQWLHNASDYQTGGALKIGTQGAREFPGLGDWCTPRGNFWDSSNSPDAAHFNNCVYAYMLSCAGNIAKALGRTDDAHTYADRLKAQQQATHRQSYDPETGKYLDGKQVDQAFALLAGVTPESEKAKVRAQLVENLLYTFPYYDTGSSGQALYTRYFVEHGERMDLVYELLRDRHHPSYGYFIEQGKTTWPERWSAVGNSQIHTCYTGIGAYFIKGIGGIRVDPDHAGFKQFLIKPAPVGDLAYANTQYESMHGNIVVNWRRDGTAATYHIEVPPNTSATVFIPATDKQHVRESDVLAEKSEGVTFVGGEPSDAVGHYVVYQVDSGVYNFYVDELPEPRFPDPLAKTSNLSTIGRMNASSMFIESEKLPGFEAFKANDENRETCWKAAEPNHQWIEVSWLKPQEFSRVVIQEQGDHITSYKVLYWTGSEWKKLVAGGECGRDRVHEFSPVKSTKCRLLIPEAAAAPTICEFQVN
ncbi:family 78 glycoside hydrolase catalytic domain [Crateriforma spongiae]|uniref:family 78 glycoside hydrolase catalytic domain n=1 Tax=Crateriforma spongiae TaxID=2724528 RepID=UPI0014452E70|nr:family 78 glycoside hydrolase catalytic domain [Crateriforma spongiae]